MKMFLVIYAQAADESVVAKFKGAGVHCYTKMEKVRGEGTETEPKLGTHTWPGQNNLLMIGVEEDEVKQIGDLIRQLKKEHPRAGVRGFVLPLEESI